MFKIVQESLTNVVKHSHAAKVKVDIAVSGKGLALTIADNGIGYHSTNSPKKGASRGWGLITMTERALAVGGTCRIESHPGTGTNVLVEVPL